MTRKYNQTFGKICIKVLDLDGPEFIEMSNWLTENIGDTNWSHRWNRVGKTIDYFYFDCEEDVVAFKLMWS